MKYLKKINEYLDHLNIKSERQISENPSERIKTVKNMVFKIESFLRHVPEEYFNKVDYESFKKFKDSL